MDLHTLQQEIIKEEGGIILKPYKDHLGYPTVGVGHLILESDEEFGQPIGTKITETRCDELLFRDLNIVLSECEERFHRSNAEVHVKCDGDELCFEGYDGALYSAGRPERLR